tara:strand:- start:802 stop:1314 length:513 start_codon:yes stop_codon:yes gene_type:complete
MSFRDKTDINPNVLVQQVQNNHLFAGNKLLPNTVKDGSGDYLNPLLDSDGRLVISSDTSHQTTITTLIDNVSYANGTHQSNSADVRSSTGTMTLQGTITGADISQSVVIRASHDNTNFFELHNVAVPLVNESGVLHFLVNFICSMSYIQIQYVNGDVVSRTVNAKLSFKN